MKVFLGGTCNGSTWRDYLIPLLKTDYFNPVVEDWTPECQQEEIRQRQECDICLYVITPKMTGSYAIAEVVDDSNKRPEKTMFCCRPFDGDHRFTDGQMNSLEMVGQMIRDNGGMWMRSLDGIAEAINRKQ